MVKCPQCGSEDYEISYIEDTEYSTDAIMVVEKACCCDCDEEFWVREFFSFDYSENIR